MRPPTRAFSPKFKQKAVRLLEASSKSGLALAQELGISDSVLSRWRKDLRARGEDAFLGKSQQPKLEEDVRRLFRENEVLQHIPTHDMLGLTHF
jgi:transposase